MIYFMDIYCLEEFKTEFGKLRKKNSYATIVADTISYFFGKQVADLQNGTRLNNSDIAPYIKKRLNGSGGFRFYYLLLIDKGRLFLMFVHAKTGSLGYGNITDEYRDELYKNVLETIENKDLYKVTVTSDNKDLDFVHMSVLTGVSAVK